MTGYPVPIQDGAPATWVAIDVAKDAHIVLVESPSGRRQFRVASRLEELQALVRFLRQQPAPVRVAFEPTGVYHRVLAYQLVSAGFDVVLVASLACARYREARYTSWDKNDPKDAGVVLDLLKQGLTMRYVDPLLAGWHDVQEIAKTYWQVTLARTRVQHSLLTHFLPLYWPEFARFWRTSRSEQFIRMLLAYPTPASVRNAALEDFIATAGSVVGRKVNKRAWLAEVYELAGRSAALPVATEGPAVATFRLRLQHFLDLSVQRAELERWADRLLGSHPDYQLLQTIPGIGPVFALTILAEAGDLRRFNSTDRDCRQLIRPPWSAPWATTCLYGLFKMSHGISSTWQRLTILARSRGLPEWLRLLSRRRPQLLTWRSALCSIGLRPTLRFRLADRCVRGNDDWEDP